MKRTLMNRPAWLLFAALALAAVPAGAGAAKYVVFPFNNLGMHCTDNDFSIFSLLPPFNTLHAQVIQVGPVPVVLTSNEVQVVFQAMADGTGSINTCSAPQVPKTNFWQYAFSLFGVNLAPDDGIEGVKMPGTVNAWGPLTFESNMRWFAANGIPITPTDDAGNFNPYPMMKVAVGPNPGPADGTPVTLPVSWEAHCDVCHETGSDGASPGFHGVPEFSAADDPVIRVRQNILTLHDAINKTALTANEPVLCASCHYSAALDLAGTGPKGAQINPATGQPYSYESHALHRHHGSPQLNGVVPIPDEGVNTCYYCHPGPTTKCLRGAMSTAGIICQNCHGGLLAVGSVNRKPWIDTPRCQSCHTGDAIAHLGNDLIRRIAFTGSADRARPILSPNKRFAENRSSSTDCDVQLYRDSMGHPGADGIPKIACPACHGSPHAEWPLTDPAANDNATPVALQGYAGTITECSVCHGDGYLAPRGKELSGPHGIHTVNHQDWWGVSAVDHKVFLANNPDALGQCRACHGKDLGGTLYSRVRTTRTFFTGPMQMNTLVVPQGTQISCSQCHASPEVRVLER